MVLLLCFKVTWEPISAIILCGLRLITLVEAILL